MTSSPLEPGRIHLAKSWRKKPVEIEQEAEIIRRFDHLAARSVQR